MSEKPSISTSNIEVKPIKPKRIWIKLLWFAIAALILIFIVGAVWIDTASGHRFIAKQINQTQNESGLQFYVEGIEGSIYRNTQIRKLRLKDIEGDFFEANNIDLQWYPFGFLSGRLSIDSLVIEKGKLTKLPLLKDNDDDGPKLPDFDIFMGELNIKSIEIAPAIIGRSDAISVSANADIQSGRARLKLLLTSLSDNDKADLDIDIAPDDDKFKLTANISAPENGFIQTLTGITWADNINVSGRGGWKNWNGVLKASLQDIENIKLDLGARDGDYSVKGYVKAVALPGGLLRNIAKPILNIDIQSRYIDKMIRFDGSANSQNIAMKLDGGYDLSIGGPDALLIDFDLIKPVSIVKNLTGEKVAGRLRIDGALSNMKIEYLVDAETLGLGLVQLESMKALGKGRRLGKIVSLPVDLKASNATGLDPQLLELMRDIDLQTIVKIDGNNLTAQNGKLKTNRITGILDIDANLRERQYDIVLETKLPSYLVQGIGLADIDAKLRFNPAQPSGIKISGFADAKLLRMDNVFLRNLSGGLPSVNAQISLGPDGVFRFSNFTVDAPLLTFIGGGQRNRDKTFLIDGAALHNRYGKAQVDISGNIAKPMVVLNLDSPLNTLGLKNVSLALTPNVAGFAFKSKGNSLLGPFVGDGVLLLPSGQDALARFDRLLVSDTVVSGLIRNSEKGLIGDFDINQGGVNGTIKMRPINDAQRVDARLNIKNARFRGEDQILIRSGSFSLSGYFDGQSSDIDATLQAQGLSSGDLILGRLAANAKIKDGSGMITASLAGTRGSGFDMTSNISVSPDRYIVKARGNYRRRPIQLTRDAVITRDDNIWNLAPTRLRYGDGQLTVSGRYGSNIIELDALIKKLPLELLDLGDSNLGFGGVASGNIQYSNIVNKVRGDAKLNIKGLTRSGLVLSSEPIDAALNMRLDNESLASRAILSREGKNVGRLQAKIDLASGDNILRRVNRGSLFAQGRFDGRADTLWRLTGVELFDLTGDAKIAFDARGSFYNPKIKGAIQTRNARLESSLSGTVITELATNGHFDGSRLRITNMRGNTSGGGSISGTGYFDLTNSNAIGINLDMKAKNALLIDRDDVAARVTGPIAITSNGNGGMISGNLIMNQGRYQLGYANAAEILPNIAVREINLRDDLPISNRNSAPWRLNIAAKAVNRFDVNGLGIDSEWSGDFKIGGRIDSPTIGGRANLVRGDYDFAGRVFKLARGTIIFNQRNPPNPQIDIVAEAAINGVDARIEVRGRSLAPEINFASIPALPQEELLARLLFGTSVLELSAPEAIQLSSAIAGLQSNGGLDPINSIRKAVGLDRLRVVSANAATGRGTGIAVGKFIGRRTFVELVTDGRGYNGGLHYYHLFQPLVNKASMLESVEIISKNY